MWEEDRSDREEGQNSPRNNLESEFHDGQNRPSSAPLSEGSGHSGKTRWGRSNFSRDEIEVLESPLNYPISQPRDNENRDYENPEKLKTRRSMKTNGNFLKIARALFLIVPALFFAAAAHFINGIMTDFKLFSASFSVFQAIFWPSFVFLVIDLVWWRGPSEIEAGDSGTYCPSLSCHNGRWKLAVLLLVHGNLTGIAMIMQLLSIQQLNISVSLALSFGPEVFVILLTFINRERKFSLELILCSLLTYVGFIVIGIPAMTFQNQRMAEGLTTGLVASLGSMTLAIPGSFALKHLRKNSVPDSLIAVSFGFQGSFYSWITKVIMGSQMDLTYDPVSFSWAGGLISLVICGTVFLFLGSRFAPSQGDRCSSGNSSISMTRMLVFILSCFWEIIRQGMWHNFPGIYDIFGSLLVFLGYVLAVGFEAWTLNESTEVRNESSPFQFISWLFSRTPVGNSSTPKMSISEN